MLQSTLALASCRYEVADKKRHTIEEIDFCRHLLYNASIPSKKKARMLKRVEKAFRHTQVIRRLDLQVHQVSRECEDTFFGCP